MTKSDGVMRAYLTGRLLCLCGVWCRMCTLDFLPFKCKGCGKTFCGDHRKASDHNCTVSFEVRHLSISASVSPCVGSFPRNSDTLACLVLW